MSSNYKTNVPPERYNMLVEAMDAMYSGMKGLSYEDAIKKIRKSIYPNDPRDFQILFGDYGVLVSSCDVLSAEKLEEVRAFLASQKKVYRGMKFYVRVFPSITYGKKKKMAVLEPGLILWEFERVSDEIALTLTNQVSAITGIQMTAVKKN